jgi:chromosomal replication initiation ATPase DnaA
MERLGKENEGIGLVVEALTKKVEELTKKLAEIEQKTSVVPDLFNFQKKFDQLVEETCKALSISKEELLNKGRKRHYVLARQIIAYIAVHHMGMSTTEIGFRIKRDHSSVIHLKNSFMDILDMDYEMEKQYYRAVLNAIR